MFHVHDFTEDDGLFLGDDLTLEFEVLSDQPELDEADPDFESTARVPEDVSAWSFAFTVRKKDTTADPALLAKTSGSGISVIGSYNADRATNTQRVQVVVDDVDTDSNSEFAQKAAIYRYALKRMNSGFEKVVTRGNLPLMKATTPES